MQVVGVAPLGNRPPQFIGELMEGPLSVPVLTSTEYKLNVVAVPISAPGGEDAKIAEINSSELFVVFDGIPWTAVAFVCAVSVTV